MPTIVITGGASFGFMHETVEALAAALPDGQTRVIEGQGHNIAPEAIAPFLKAFFAG